MSPPTSPDMSDVYEFVQGETSVPLARDEDGGAQRGTVDVEVTSRLDRHDHVALRVEPGEGTEESWFSIEPKRHFLQTDDTVQATVTIEVPPGTVPAGEPPRPLSFRVGAYAETNQQEDFTLGQVHSFEVAPDDGGGGIPWWVLAAAGAAVVLVLGLAAWLLLRGSDRYEVADMVGGTVAEAEAAFDGDVDAFPGPGAAGGPDDCVLLQAPGRGATAERVAVYTVACPTPSPTPLVPELGDVCADAPGFCEAVDRSFSSTEWPAAQVLMVDAFRGAFTIEGVETPNVIGLPLIEARSALQSAGLDWAEVGDGSANQTCRDDDDQNLGKPVLLQHPFATTMAAADATVTLVLTACPDEVGRPEDVQIDSLLDTTNFANLEAAVPAYAGALRDDPFLGPEFLASDALAERLAEMVELFRYSFAVAQVPDVVDKSLSNAKNLMTNAGLTVETELGTAHPPPTCHANTFIFCLGYTQVSIVVEQSLEPELRIADLPADQVVTLTYDTSWRSDKFYEVVQVPRDVTDQLLAESGLGD